MSGGKAELLCHLCEGEGVHSSSLCTLEMYTMLFYLSAFFYNDKHYIPNFLHDFASFKWIVVVFFIVLQANKYNNQSQRQREKQRKSEINNGELKKIHRHTVSGVFLLFLLMRMLCVFPFRTFGLVRIFHVLSPETAFPVLSHILLPLNMSTNEQANKPISKTTHYFPLQNTGYG